MKNIKIIKYILLALNILAFYVFIDPEIQKIFAKIAWYLLILIVFSRPLADIFKNLGFLKKIVILRKEIWILCATFWIAHVVGIYMKFNSTPLEFFTGSNNWNFAWPMAWWMLAFLISIPLLVTSNIASMKFLGKNWKKIQRLTYLFFIFTALHVAFLRPDKMIINIWLVLAWLILRILAYKKITINTNNKVIWAILVLLPIIWIAANEQEWEKIKKEPRDNNLEQNESIEKNSDNSNIQIDTSSYSSEEKLSISSGCIWCSKCVRIDPTHFTMEWREAKVTNQENLNTTSLERAISSCPVDVIKLS